MTKRIVRRKASTSSGKQESKLVCSLCDHAASPRLMGTGSGNVAVVLGSPSYAEDTEGEYGVGPAAGLLESLLDEAGIEEYFLTSVVKCYPADQKISAADIKLFKPILEEELSGKDFVLVLGATAVKGVLGKGKITQIHGQQFPRGEATVVPTFSPGVALRDPAKLVPLRRDILRFGKLVRGEREHEKIHHQVIRTPDDWNIFIEEYRESPEVALDIETTGLDRLAEGAAINSIQVGLSTGRNWALPLAARDSPWSRSDQELFMNTLVRESKDKKVIGQNFKFDNLWIKTHFGIKFHLNFDTMLAHHVLDENSPHGLKIMSSVYCDAPNYDVDLKTKLGQGNMGKFYEYGCYDVYYTLKLYRIFRKKFLKDPSLRRLFYRLVMPTARMFEKVEEGGLFINVDKLDETEKRLTKKKGRILKELNELAGDEINWNSPTQIARLFYETLKIPPLEFTATGKPSTGESVLMRTEHPIAEKLIEYRGVEKNLSTYVLGWRNLMHGDRLYLGTKIHGTVTGRFSSRLHQVPRDPTIRSHITAPDGWTFVCADYSQIELRLAAMLSNDNRMKLIFQTGGDIHRHTAAEVLGKPDSEVTKDERKMAKAVNFGLVYGMGWPKLVIYARDNYGVDMTNSEAKQFRRRFFELYSALPVWHERQRRCVRAFGQVVSLSGRVRRLPGIDSSDRGMRAEAERQAINSPVQGFGSGDLKAMAMVEISDTFKPKVLQIKGEVHDSILMWVRTKLLDSTLPRVKKIMEQPHLLETFGIKMTVPLVVDFEVGPWGEGKEWK